MAIFTNSDDDPAFNPLTPPFYVDSDLVQYGLDGNDTLNPTWPSFTYYLDGGRGNDTIVANAGSGDVVVMRIHRSFSTTSTLRFAVVECPPIGSVCVFDRPGPRQELVHLAANRAEAEAWLAHCGYPSAVIDDVVAGEVAVAGEGRVA